MKRELDTKSLEDAIAKYGVLVSEREGAELLKTSTHYLRKLRAEKTGPRFSRVGGGRLVRYQVRDLLAWALSKAA